MTPDEDRRISNALDILQNKNAELKKERDSAQEQVRQARNRISSLESALRDLQDIINGTLR